MSLRNQALPCHEGGVTSLFNQEAEQQLLGALLAQNKGVDRIPPELSDDHFYFPIHGRIFKAIHDAFKSGRVANPITLPDYFLNDNDFAEIGGKSYLLSLASSVFTISSGLACAQTIMDLHARRALLCILDDGKDSVMSAGAADNATSIANRVRDSIQSMAGITTSRGLRTYEEGVLAVISGFRKGFRGVPTGISDLDAMLGGGIAAGTLNIIAGETSMGKTTLAETIIEQAIAGDYPTYFLSQEMTVEELARKRLARVLLGDGHDITMHKLRNGYLTRDEETLVADQVPKMSGIRVHIDDGGSVTMAHISNRVREMHKKYENDEKPLLVVIDYLQLVRLPGKRADHIELAEAAQDIVTWAKAYGIAVIILSQLTRSVVSNSPDRRPTLHSLNRSGGIAQAADNVMLVYRPEHVHKDNKPAVTSSNYAEELVQWQNTADEIRGYAEIICPKVRAGSTGSVDCYFDGPRQLFMDANR